VTEALQLEIRTLRALLDSERDPAGRAFAPLADAYRRAGKIPDALKILREGIAKHPDFATGHVVAAQLYVEQGLSHEGALAARRALELDAENVLALKSLLRALDETGQAQEARRVRSTLTSLEPDFVPDWAVASPPAQAVAPPAAPALQLGSTPPAPVSPEPDGIPMIEATGMIDLTTIGPIPSADLPVSPLAPEPPPLATTSKGVGLGSGEMIDLDLMDFTLGGDEPAADLPTVAPPPEDPVFDLPLLDPEAAAGEPVLDLPLLEPEAAAGEPVPDLPLLEPETAAAEPMFDLPLLEPEASVASPAAELPLVDPEPTVEEPVMELAALATDGEETVLDVGSLAPESVEEPVMELADLAPSAARADETVVEMASLAPDPADDEPVMDVAALAPDAEEAVVDVGSLAPDEVEEPVMELADLAPSRNAGADEAVMDVAALAPDAADEPVMDVAALAPDPRIDDEAVVDVGSLAPDADEAVLDIGWLAPEAAEEPVMALADLAPEPADEPVMDLQMLAPDPEETVVDLASLAPSPEVEEPIYELEALAPAAVPAGQPVASGAPLPQRLVPDDEPVFDLDTLAPARVQPEPDAGAEAGNGQMSVEEAVEIGFLSPDEPDAVVIDLDELRPDTATSTAASGTASPPSVSVAAADVADSAVGSEEPAEDHGAPIYTRTLAELYAAQGASKQALRVLRHLLNENPQDADLARRIAEVESGTPRQPVAPEPQHEEEVDTLARELAESGRGSQEVDSPFTWSGQEAEGPASVGGPTIREYFEGLLDWQPREDT